MATVGSPQEKVCRFGVLDGMAKAQVNLPLQDHQPQLPAQQQVHHHGSQRPNQNLPLPLNQQQRMNLKMTAQCRVTLGQIRSSQCLHMSPRVHLHPALRLPQHLNHHLVPHLKVIHGPLAVLQVAMGSQEKVGAARVGECQE